MNKTAWGYARLSQSGRDGSLDEQLADIREYVRDTDDLELATTLNEGANTSGFNDDRPKYRRLLDNMDSGSVDAVVVRDRARLSRDFDERLRLLTRFRGDGVEWHVVEAGGRINVSDVQTAAMEAMHAAMDHMKKKMEIERSKQVVEERMADPDVDHGGVRFGMKYRDDGRRQVPGEKWKEVERIFELADAGESKRAIARDEQVSASRRTIKKVIDRREWYEARAQGSI